MSKHCEEITKDRRRPSEYWETVFWLCFFIYPAEKSSLVWPASKTQAELLKLPDLLY